MHQSFEEPKYADLQREIAALRKRIEDLESERARPQGGGRSSRWRSLSRRPGLAVATVVALAGLLALGAMSAEKNDPLFIDQNGNVGINQAKPEAPLDVNGNAIIRGNLNLSGNLGINQPKPEASLDVNGGSIINGVIKGSGILNLGDSLFVNSRSNGTASVTRNAYIDEKGQWQIKDPKKKAFTLEIRDSGQLELYGTKTEGKDDWQRMADFDAANNVIEFPSEAPVKIRGQIRGSLWNSAEYQWDQGKPKVTMTKADHSACFLTYVKGDFRGWGEFVEITKNGNGSWVLGGSSGQKDVTAKARCIGAPDDAW